MFQQLSDNSHVAVFSRCLYRYPAIIISTLQFSATFQQLSGNIHVALSAAVFRGVQPLLFALSNLAPCFSSSRTTSTWILQLLLIEVSSHYYWQLPIKHHVSAALGKLPRDLLSCSVERWKPLLYALSNLASCFSSSRKISTGPFSAALFRGF